MRFRRMRYAIWLPLAAKAVACLGAAGATKPLAPTAKMARHAFLSMVTDATAACCAALALRGGVLCARLSCSECVRVRESRLRRRAVAHGTPSRSSRRPESPRVRPSCRVDFRGPRPRGTGLVRSCGRRRRARAFTYILTPPPPPATASHTPRRLSAAALHSSSASTRTSRPPRAPP